MRCSDLAYPPPLSVYRAGPDDVDRIETIAYLSHYVVRQLPGSLILGYQHRHVSAIARI